MPHVTPVVDVEFLEAALEFTEVQLRRAQQEICRLRALVELRPRLEIR